MFTLSQPDPWLTSRYGGRFNDHLHAMGAVLVGFNLLEQSFRSKLACYLGCDEAITGYIYDVMAENSVRQIANMAVRASRLPDDVKAAEFAFTSAFGKCAQNRNCVAHSFLKTADKSNPQGEAVLEKWTRKTFNQEHHYSATLSELRQVADDMKIVTTFGQDVFYYICLNHADCFAKLAGVTIPPEGQAPQTLPTIPPEPTLLPSLPPPLP